MRYVIERDNGLGQRTFYASPFYGFQPNVYLAYETLIEAETEAAKHYKAIVTPEEYVLDTGRLEVEQAEKLGLRPGHTVRR